MPSQEKKERVKSIKKWFSDADSLFVLHYTGLRVSEANELRNILSDFNVELRVLKKTLTKIALVDTEHEQLEPLLQGPIAVVFVKDDPAAVARAIRDFSRESPGLFFQGGMLESKMLDRKQVEWLSTLPPREVLIGQLIGQVRSPIAGLVGLCSAPTREMLGVMSAIARNKEEKTAA